MKFTEYFDVRQYGAGGWTSLGKYENEVDAVMLMDSFFADRKPGSWRVVRVMEVTTHTASR